MIPQFFRLAACQANAPYFFCTAEDPNRRNQSKKYSKNSDRISNSPSQFVHWFSILPWGGVLSTSFQLIHDQERDAEKWWWGQSKKKTGGTFCSCLPIWLSLGTSLAVSQFEVLATLDFDLLDELARGALQFQGDLLGCLGLRKKWKIVTQTFNARFCRPSCGTRASSDHRNPSASCRNVSYLVRQRLPYQLCTAPLCGSDVSCMVPPCRMSFLSSDIAPYLCPMVKKKGGWSQRHVLVSTRDMDQKVEEDYTSSVCKASMVSGLQYIFISQEEEDDVPSFQPAAVSPSAFEESSMKKIGEGKMRGKLCRRERARNWVWWTRSPRWSFVGKEVHHHLQTSGW